MKSPACILYITYTLSKFTTPNKIENDVNSLYLPFPISHTKWKCRSQFKINQKIGYKKSTFIFWFCFRFRYNKFGTNVSVIGLDFD